jgi:hypothetical protein
MRTIVIPTDYHEDTLQAMEMTWRSTGEESIRVVLLSVSPIPDSITEYLFLPANKEIPREKRNQLLGEWRTRESLLEISVQLIEHHQYGSSFPLIEQIIERFEVTQIIVPYSFQNSKKHIEIEALKALKKTKCKLMLMPDRSRVMEIKVSPSQWSGQLLEKLEGIEH